MASGSSRSAPPISLTQAPASATATPGVVPAPPLLPLEPGAHGGRHLGHPLPYLPDVGARELQRQEVRLGEVAVVVGELLAAQLVYLVGLGVVVEGGLLDATPAREDLLLPVELAGYALPDKAEGVHVL